MVEDDLAIDPAHVALGATVEDFGGQAVAEGHAGQTAVPTVMDEKPGGKGETGFDDGLAAQRMADVDSFGQA